MWIEQVPSKKNKKGYVYQITFRYTDIYGRVKKHKKSGFQTKKEAKQYAEKKQKELEDSGGVSPNCKVTIGEAFAQYMDLEGKGKYSPNTVGLYQRTYKTYIETKLGAMKVSTIQYVTLQRFFNELTMAGAGKSTVSNIKKVLSLIFKFSVKAGYIKESPLRNVEAVGKNTYKEPECITYDQLESLVESIESQKVSTPKFNDYSRCVALYLGYYLGLRKSETMALLKDDVDFENNRVSINGQVVYQGLLKKDWYITSRLKTEGSKTTLPLCKPLKEILERWFKYNPFDLVCCDVDGEFLSPASMDKCYSHHAQKLGFKFRYHLLRHAFVTQLIISGTDVKTTAQLARHKNLSVTLGIYTNISEAMMERAIEETFENQAKSAPKIRSEEGFCSKFAPDLPPKKENRLVSGCHKTGIMDFSS